MIVMPLPLADSHLICVLERRFRSALTHLETAMKAGIKPAAKVLMDVHYDMSELYQSQAQQYRDLESLRK